MERSMKKCFRYAQDKLKEQYRSYLLKKKKAEMHERITKNKIKKAMEQEFNPTYIPIHEQQASRQKKMRASSNFFDPSISTAPSSRMTGG